jgi:phosphoribosyl 1,2-cyclic phosphodiesterase
MKLKIVGTGSKGNAYIFENEDEALLLEAGVNFKSIKTALNFNLKKVVGMLVTHRHGDHSKGAKEASLNGVDIYCPQDVIDNCGVLKHRSTAISHGQNLQLGGFKIKVFTLEHDVPSVGFLINHEETGRFCFITDTMYCKYNFDGLNNIIIEANYCDTILKKRLEAGEEPSFLHDRVLKSHMSLATCKDFLQANDLKKVRNIVMIHLSDRNSHSERFRKEVRDLTGKKVTIAENGMEIDFNKSIF